jgi:hypothetical protein
VRANADPPPRGAGLWRFEIPQPVYEINDDGSFELRTPQGSTTAVAGGEVILTPPCLFCMKNHLTACENHL